MPKFIRVDKTIIQVKYIIFVNRVFTTVSVGSIDKTTAVFTHDSEAAAADTYNAIWNQIKPVS